MESQTRREWRTRIVALLDYERTHGCRRTDIEEWLNDFMQTPELELAEYRDGQPSAPNLRLAVVDVGLQPVLYRQERGVEGLLHYIEELDVYRVVKME